MTLRITAILCFVMAVLCGNAQPLLKPIAKFSTNVQEPSDIAYNADYTQLYIVSDNGVLHRTDTLGKKIRLQKIQKKKSKKHSANTPDKKIENKKSKKNPADTLSKKTSKAADRGLDFEGLCFYNNLLYVTDERARRVMVFTPDSMKLVQQNELSYNGAMNQGYEAITYNETKKCFIVVTEKEPCWLFELNSDLIKINEKKLKIASDLSGLCFHNGFVYALSDQDQMVLQLDPNSYAVIQKWQIPVTNPEGITFDKAGNMVILSDVEQKIYKFKINP